MKKVIIIILIVILILGIAFAGVNIYQYMTGQETWISSIFGFLNKEDNEQPEELKDINISATIKEAAMNENILVIIYELDTTNISSTYIALKGDYNINNDIHLIKVNETSQKISDNKYRIYTMFNVEDYASRINDIRLSMNINTIIGYENTKDLVNENIENKTYTGNWPAEMIINQSDIQNMDTRYLQNSKISIAIGLDVEVTQLISNDFINILSIKTDKTEYIGNTFDLAFRVLDERGNELAYGNNKDLRTADYNVYIDNVLLKNMSKDSKLLKIEIFMKNADRGNYSMVKTLEVDLVNATQEVPIKYENYNQNGVSFKYNKLWTLRTEKSKQVFDIPTAEDRKSILSISVKSQAYTQDRYIERVKAEIKMIFRGSDEQPEYTVTWEEIVKLIANEEKYIVKGNTTITKDNYSDVANQQLDIIEEGSFSFANIEGYQITVRLVAEGETYINKVYFVIDNQKVYTFDYFAAQTDYDYINMKEIIDNLIKSVNIDTTKR